jgi:hypothetical protein
MLDDIDITEYRGALIVSPASSPASDSPPHRAVSESEALTGAFVILAVGVGLGFLLAEDRETPSPLASALATANPSIADPTGTSPT